MHSHTSVSIAQRISLPWRLGQKLTASLMPIADVLLRVYVAQIFWMAGWSKTRDWEMTISLFTDEYQVPWLSAQIAAWLCTVAELILPVMLVLGLWRSLAAFGLLVVNAMAVISYYHVLKDMPVALQDHVEWGLMLFILICQPVQKLSLDYFLRSKKL